MTTSGSTDFAVTEATIIEDAMLEIGALASGESPTAAETVDARRMLNMMLKHWQATKTFNWPLLDVTVTLVPGTESYLVGTTQTVNTALPLRVIAARRRDTSSIDVPIEVYSRQEYMEIPVKSTQAPANGVYYHVYAPTIGKLYVWPTGSTGNTSVIITVVRPLEDFDATGDTPDFPVEYSLAMVKNLAVKIAPQFRKQPSNFLIAEADRLLAELVEQDQEQTSIYFRPGRR